MKAKIKYHDGASRLERHGAMWDMAASETVTLRKGEVKVIPLGVSMKLPDGFMGVLAPRFSTCIKHGIIMANSVGIIENDYCGDSDVWGFVAYAIRDTVIERGTRIAQFMPVKYADPIEFEEVESMGCADRGGYGSTGEKSNGGEPSFCDRRGRKLTVGCYCRISGTDSCGIVKKLYESKERGPIVLADFDGYGEMRKRCVDVELDDRPRDYDVVPIEVGDVLYQTTFEGEPIGDPMEVKRYTGNALFVKGLALPINAWTCTHREPADSWERLEEDANLGCRDYCEKHRLEECDYNMRVHILARAKKLAGIEEQR